MWAPTPNALKKKELKRLWNQGVGCWFNGGHGGSQSTPRGHRGYMKQKPRMETTLAREVNMAGVLLRPLQWPNGAWCTPIYTTMPHSEGAA